MPIEKFNTEHYFETFSFGDDYPNQFNPLERRFLKKNLPEPEQEANEDVTDEISNRLKELGFLLDSRQLQGNKVSDRNNSAINYRYFLKIIPTTYEYLNGRVINNTYQYSVARSAKLLNQQIFGAELPGVFVSYELSPIMIKYIERSKSFSHFITSCCAIIGGLFTVAGMLDALTYRYYNMYKKYQLNKLS